MVLCQVTRGMEFERALFRIHQRSLDSEIIQKVRIVLERWLPWTILVLAICLAVLHIDYVGKAACLPAVLVHAGLWNTTANEPAIDSDVLLSISLGEESVYGDEPVDIRLRMGESASVDTSSGSAGELGVEAETATVLGQKAEGLLLASSRSRRAAGYNYRFSKDREVAFLSARTFQKHNFTVHNVTIPDHCLAPSRVLREALQLFDAFDGIIINELAYTFRSRGYLERFDRGVKIESWAWSADQVEAASPLKGRSVIRSMLRKAAVLVKATGTFLLISAITGLFIRIAVNGSAVLMFPIALCAQRIGLDRVSMGILSRSFPWIGVHVQILQRAGQPLAPLFRSHLTFLFLQSFTYLSCNLAWRFILYRKTTPEGFEERVFSFCSIIELFNLIFVRSTSSMLVFPKLITACMVYLHFYIFCCFYPFHMLALLLCTATCAYIMVYCLNHFEEPAIRADPFSPATPTNAHPRAAYMPRLSPSWSVESAPMWTMFYPPDDPDVFSAEAMQPISMEEYAMV